MPVAARNCDGHGSFYFAYLIFLSVLFFCPLFVAYLTDIQRNNGVGRTAIAIESAILCPRFYALLSFRLHGSGRMRDLRIRGHAFRPPVMGHAVKPDAAFS